MTYWYYQFLTQDAEYNGVIETAKDNFPLADVCTVVSDTYRLDIQNIKFNLIQQINHEDYINCYAFNSKLRYE